MSKIFLFLSLLILNSCGFKPLYKKSDYNPNIFYGINLTQVEGENKHRIRKKITDILNLQPAEDYTYELKITFNKNKNSIGIGRDGLTYRYEINYILNYDLVDLKTEKKIASDNFSLFNSYDVTDSEFANFMANNTSDENTENQLIEELKNKIYLDLKFYYNEN